MNYTEYKINTVSTYGVRLAVARELGDTDPFTPVRTRPWYTSDGSIFIREDQPVPAILTYALLRNQ